MAGEDDSDKFSDEDDIQTMMQKNSRKRYQEEEEDEDEEEEDDDASSTASSRDGAPQMSFLETMQLMKKQKEMKRLSLLQDDDDDDSDDDIIVAEKDTCPPPATTAAAVPPAASRPIVTLDDSSDEDEATQQRVKQSLMMTDPSLQRLQHARLLAQSKGGDHTQILEEQAEYYATQHAHLTRRTYFDIQPIWNAPSEALQKLPPIVRVKRTPEMAQVHHLTAQLLKQLEFKRAEHYTVALRLDNRLLGGHELVSKLKNGNLQAVLYHDGVMLKKAASVPKKKMIRLTVRSPDGKSEQVFQIGESDQFSELMEQYYQKNQVRVTLHFDGETLRPNQTPKMMDMEDEDLIDSRSA
ncbi:hypothetical protein FisN_28Hh062 [Fistulifera solaris]|uniref:Rad60/SUMO-like domain-containing protein n=1 Tax=Fistulifera solaris TaxID=1519565 RepID=A0A1Z5KHS2_FISSO|nr:hypothetical protein FisN_28Hh062 [Fistulifera solaris]|eukprot:GAX25591.1 hypothetical protein FisN_28Hh062 [Fistulifera solaris]